MWRKVGVIGATSNTDNKSNRSRDQNPIEQPFWQTTKQRMFESQIFFEGNDYFFSNHISKVKDSDSIKHTSQESIKLNKLSQVRSLKQLSSEYGQGEGKKKSLYIERIQELDKRLNEDNFGASQKNDTTMNGDDKVKTTQSTERIQSSTSIDNNVTTLKQCRSTPQLNLPQIKPITEQIPLQMKIQTKKNIEMLRKQHSEIKKALQSELNEFSNEFQSMQAEMSNKISRVMADKIRNNSGANESQDNLDSRKLKCQQLMPETKKFA